MIVIWEVSELTVPTSSSDWDWRTFIIAILGWAIPLLIALPLAWGHESAGGEAVLWAGLVGSGMGVVGCLVAGAVIGARVSPRGSASDAFGIGLAGIASSGLVILLLSIAVEALVTVLHLGIVPLLVLIPFALAYSVGFGLGRIL